MMPALGAENCGSFHAHGVVGVITGDVEMQLAVIGVNSIAFSVISIGHAR